MTDDEQGADDPGEQTEPSDGAEPDEPTDPDAEADDERPELADEEKADLDLDGVDLDAIDGGTDDSGDGTDEESDEGDSSTHTSDGDSGNLATPDDGETWGDMYVDLLAVVLVSIVEEYGDEDSDVSAGEIEELANNPPIALNEQADRLFEEMGGTKDLPPGQALAVGSATVAGSVILRETDVASDLVNELTNRGSNSEDS